MNSIDNGEWERLKSWARLTEDKNSFHREKSEELDSFWITREREDSYIMAYDFDTLPEFEGLCKEIFKMPMDNMLQRIIAVATFKNIPDGDSEEIETNMAERDEKLPEYRYVF